MGVAVLVGIRTRPVGDVPVVKDPVAVAITRITRRRREGTRRKRDGDRFDLPISPEASVELPVGVLRPAVLRRRHRVFRHADDEQAVVARGCGYA